MTRRSGGEIIAPEFSTSVSGLARGWDLHEALTKYKIEHFFEIYQGDHRNRIAERIESKALLFLTKHLSFKRSGNGLVDPRSHSNKPENLSAKHCAARPKIGVAVRHEDMPKLLVGASHLTRDAKNVAGVARITSTDQSKPSFILDEECVDHAEA